MSSPVELAAPAPHRLWVGDLEAGGADALREAAITQRGVDRENGITAGWPVFDACYTDPPWNAGIGRIFRKWAGDDRPVDINGLLERTVELIARDVAGWAFLQIGVQKRDALAAMVDEHPAMTFRGLIDCTQVNDGGSRVEGAAWLVACHRADSRAQEQSIPAVAPESSWMDLAADVLGQVTQPGEWVVDWYMGQGMTMRVAERLGLQSWGLELNAARAGEAVARTQKDRDAAASALDGAR